MMLTSQSTQRISQTKPGTWERISAPFGDKKESYSSIPNIQKPTGMQINKPLVNTGTAHVFPFENKNSSRKRTPNSTAFKKYYDQAQYYFTAG
jgi:hypothetical protein